MTSRSCSLATSSVGSRPGYCSRGYGFFGHKTSTPRVVNEPPISGQSASVKHGTPWTGMPGPTNWRATSTCLEHAVDNFGAVASGDRQLLDAGVGSGPPSTTGAGLPR